MLASKPNPTSYTTTTCLAATCVELISTLSTTSFALNQLVRSSRPHLRDLQAQLVTTKQALDRLVALLDRDRPAFAHAQDLRCLGLHCDAVRVVVDRGVQALMGEPDDGDARRTEQRLARQAVAIEVYCRAAKVDGMGMGMGGAATKIESEGDRACVKVAQQDAAIYLDVDWVMGQVNESPPDYEVAIARKPCPVPLAALTATARTTMTTMTTDEARNGGGIGTEGAATSPPIAPRVISSPSLASDVTSVPSRESSSSSFAKSETNHSNSASASTLDLSRIRGLTSSPSCWDLPSRRKIKSTILMTNYPATSSSCPTKPDSQPSPQWTQEGPELFPAEFKTRLANYTRGITPSWDLITIPRKKGPGEKARYRNHFTSDPSTDLAPEKLASRFQIADKPLWTAILHRDQPTVHATMARSWNDNVLVEKGLDRLAALHMAASLGMCSLVEELLANGASHKVQDATATATPLHYAADFGCPSCVRLLVAAGASTDRENAKRGLRSPLWYAVARGKGEAVETLLELGARFFTQAKTPTDTLLYLGVQSGDVRTAGALLRAGVEPDEGPELAELVRRSTPDMQACLRVGAAGGPGSTGVAELGGVAKAVPELGGRVVEKVVPEMSGESKVVAELEGRENWANPVLQELPG